MKPVLWVIEIFTVASGWVPAKFAHWNFEIGYESKEEAVKNKKRLARWSVTEPLQKFRVTRYEPSVAGAARFQKDAFKRFAERDKRGASLLEPLPKGLLDDRRAMKAWRESERKRKSWEALVDEGVGVRSGAGVRKARKVKKRKRIQITIRKQYLKSANRKVRMKWSVDKAPL